MPKLNVAILGAGRMGQELLRALAASTDLSLAGVWARRASGLFGKELSGLAGARGSAMLVSDDPDAVLAAADVAVDFTLPGANPRVLDAIAASRTPLVCGVSGLPRASVQAMQRLSAELPILYDRNMSVGVAVLDAMVEQAAPALGPGFSAEVHDTHHEHKVDAPSGTALQLGETLAASRGQDFAAVYRYELGEDPRQAVPPDTIRFLVRRVGEVPGEHTVVFASAAERLELTHKVAERRVFADGALRAARWLARQGPGWYRMRDLLSN